MNIKFQEVPLTELQGHTGRRLQIAIGANGSNPEKDEWTDLPRWATFLIKAGGLLASHSDGMRRIGLISMPCETVAAGLIALGAIGKHLRIPGANDRAVHLNRIRQLANQQGNTEGILDLRNPRGRKRGPYKVEGEYGPNLLWAVLQSDPTVRVTISLETSRYWKFQDETAVQLIDGRLLAYGDIYAALPSLPEALIPEGLSTSDSSVCLSGKTMGGRATYDSYNAIRIKTTDGVPCSLAQLLTVHPWSDTQVSRIAYFNPRMKTIDRMKHAVRLVIADGADSFLSAVSEFPTSSILGTYDRSADHDVLDQLGNKIQELTQWYKGDSELLEGLGEIPPSIGVLACSMTSWNSTITWSISVGCMAMRG